MKMPQGLNIRPNWIPDRTLHFPLPPYRVDE
jgi:hypothetical protein